MERRSIKVTSNNLKQKTQRSRGKLLPSATHSFILSQYNGASLDLVGWILLRVDARIVIFERYPTKIKNYGINLAPLPEQDWLPKYVQIVRGHYTKWGSRIDVQ
ncbi:hypothetical protein M5K25_016141 [Dendrobium thyrsiflorum]|uniref:Uncharacterized protein n=1 Tax=Dendrobium thyrsiflorum TaxID=117978 RepID=A0ABD0V070_DENTH